MKKIWILIIICSVLCLFTACNTTLPIEDFETVTNTEDSIDTMYNKNEILTYTITFISNGGSSIEDITTNLLEKAPQPIKDGYTFEGWYLNTGLTSKVKFPLNVDKDITLYAKWTKIEYIVTFDTNGGNKILASKTSIISQAPQPTKDGYLFEGWFLDKNLNSAAVFPLYLNNNITLYAKWLQLEKTTTYNDMWIKDWTGYSSEKYISVTPNGFDMERLSTLNYFMSITVSYDVRYQKDYDALLNIGYMGAPKYETALYNSDNIGTFLEDINTKTSSVTKTMIYTAKVSDLKNDRITLMFSTNNIQNIIYFENITITYQCYQAP